MVKFSEYETEREKRLAWEHDAEISDVLRRVQARGGPAPGWSVDLKNRCATLAGTMEVGFYVLRDGGFSPSFYRRIDRHAHRTLDLPLIDDAVACIAEAIRTAGPKWHEQG